MFWIWSNARTMIWLTTIWKIGSAAGGNFLKRITWLSHFPKGFLALLYPHYTSLKLFLYTTLLISDFLLVFLDSQVGIFKSEFPPKCSVKNSDLKSEFSQVRIFKSEFFQIWSQKILTLSQKKKGLTPTLVILGGEEADTNGFWAPEILAEC